MKSKKTPSESTETVRTEISYTLGSCSSPFLRAGLAGLYMNLDGLSQEDAPCGLTWKLKKNGIDLEWEGDSPEPLQWILKESWKVREGVLYCPAIHKSDALTSERVHFHRGMMATFLQHNKIQPREGQESFSVDLDDKKFKYSILSLSEKNLKYIKDFDDESKSSFRNPWNMDRAISLSGYVLPGSPPRFRYEDSWAGKFRDAYLLWFAPQSCGFVEVEPKRGTWCILIPEIQDLKLFSKTKKRLDIKSIDLYAASPGDAALRYILRYRSNRYHFNGIYVSVVGKVPWNKNQPVRIQTFNLRPKEHTYEIYKALRTSFEDRIRETKDKESHWIATPFAVARISDNLIRGKRWYSDFGQPASLHRESLERRRKQSNKSKDSPVSGSTNAIWFKTIQIYERKELIDFMENEVIWSSPLEKYFVNAFHESLSRLYAREAAFHEKRHGARSLKERWTDLNDRIYRSITRAKTEDQLRSSISEFWARAGRPPHLKEHTGELWSFITKDWRYARDLALVSLASYKGKGADELEHSDIKEHEEDVQ